MRIQPHPAQRKDRTPVAILCQSAYALSQKYRKRIEEIFGWAKTTGCLRKSRYKGVARTHAHSQYVIAAWNLVRMAKLKLTAPPPAVRA